MRCWCWWPSSYPCWDCIFRRCSNRQIRPRRSFHCQSTPPCDSLGETVRWSCWWLSKYPCWDCISSRCLRRHCHPKRSFHCQSTLLYDQIGHWVRWSCWWPSNYSCWDCISRRYSTAPSFHLLHPRRSFQCRSTPPCDRVGPWARWSWWWPSRYRCIRSADPISTRGCNWQSQGRPKPEGCRLMRDETFSLLSLIGSVTGLRR